jgi:hypothetical protein
MVETVIGGCAAETPTWAAAERGRRRAAIRRGILLIE